MNRITIREVKMEWIYIGTTRVYSLERLFKIGSTTRLTSRIPQYNTGRPGAADPFYYAWAIKCFNAKDLDYHIQKLLADFKYQDPKKVTEEQIKDNKGEMYHGIKFSDLKDILTFVVYNFDASIEYLTNFIKTRLDESRGEEDEVIPPMDLKRVTCLIGDQEEVINIEDEDNIMLKQEFENILTNLKEPKQRQQEQKEKQKQEEDEESEESEKAIVVERMQLVNSLVLHTNDTRKNVWTWIKALTGWTNSRTEIEEGSFKYKIVY